MDGIGYIGGPRNIAGTGITRGAGAIQKQKETSQAITDGVVSGAFTGPEMQDPRKMFNRGPEIKDPMAAMEGNRKPEIKIGSQAEITSLDALYNGGADKFRSMGLNGPGGKEIVTMTGIKITVADSNPRFLFQE